MPALTRNEMNRSDDIIREVGVRPMRRRMLDKPHVTQGAVPGCEGKVAFASRPEAEARKPRHCIVYRCAHCGKWHAGNPTKGRG